MNISEIKNIVQLTVGDLPIKIQVTSTGSQLIIVFNRQKDVEIDYFELSDKTIYLLKDIALGNIESIKFYGKKNGQTVEWQYTETLITNKPQKINMPQNPSKDKILDVLKRFSSFFQLNLQLITGISAFGIFILMLLNALPENNRWEYTTHSVSASATSYRGISNSESTAIGSLETDESIKKLGKDGWELVNSFLEHETVHPNFGNSEYVTGLQPNVRPSRLVLIFKRKKGIF